MNEMVERVAKVLYNERMRLWKETSHGTFDVETGRPEITWETDNEPYRDQLRREARLAIEAMETPDADMVDAAVAPFRHGNTEQFDMAMRVTVTGYWAKMIEAALK